MTAFSRAPSSASGAKAKHRKHTLALAISSALLAANPAYASAESATSSTNKQSKDETSFTKFPDHPYAEIVEKLWDGFDPKKKGEPSKKQTWADWGNTLVASVEDIAKAAADPRNIEAQAASRSTTQPLTRNGKAFKMDSLAVSSKTEDAVKATGGASGRITDSVLSVSADGRAGLSAADADTAIEFDSGLIYANGDQSTAVLSENGAGVQLQRSIVSAVGKGSTGLQASGADSMAKLEGVLVFANGEASRAVRAEKSAHVDIGVAGLVASGDKSIGLHASDAETSVRLDTVGVIAMGKESVALLADSGTSVNVNVGALVAAGDGAQALQASDEGTEVAVTGGLMFTHGNESVAARVTKGASLNMEGVALGAIGADTIAIHGSGENTKINMTGGLAATYGGRNETVRVEDGAALNMTGVGLIALGEESVGLRGSGAKTEINLNSGLVGASAPAAKGVYLDDGASLSAAGVGVFAMGEDAIGVHALGKDTTVGLTGALVGAAGEGSTALAVDRGATLAVMGGGIAAYGMNAAGVRASGEDSAVGLMGGLVGAVGDGSTAVAIDQGAALNIEGAGIAAIGQNATGVLASDAGSVARIEHALIGAYDNHSSLEKIVGERSIVSDEHGYKHVEDAVTETENRGSANTRTRALVVERGAAVELEKVGLVAAGEGATGLQVSRQGSSATLNTSAVLAAGEGARGVHAANGGSTKIADSMVGAYGAEARGLSAFGYDASVDIERSFIAAGGERSVGIQASRGSAGMMRDSTVLSSGDNAGGVLVEGATVSLKDSTISSFGQASYGVGLNGGSVNLENSSVVAAGAGSAGAAINTGDFNMAGGSLEGESYAFFVSPEHDVNISLSGGARVTGDRLMAVALEKPVDVGNVNLRLDGAVVASGDIVRLDLQDAARIADGEDESVASRMLMRSPRSAPPAAAPEQANRIQVALQGGSSWTGATKAVDRLDIGKDSTWAVSDSSEVGDLAMAGGSVDFMAANETARKTLTVRDTLSGQGTLRMQAGESSDKIVAGKADGNFKVLVKTTGGELPEESRKLIEVADGSGAKFELANADGETDAGSKKLTLKPEPNKPAVTDPAQPEGGKVEGGKVEGGKVDGNETTATGETAPTVPAGKGTTWKLVDTGKLSTTADAAVNTSSAATMHGIWASEMTPLSQRLGELRMGEDAGGLWVRGFGEQQRFANKVATDFRQRIGGVELGADKRLPTAQGRLHVGGLVSYSNTSRRFEKGGKGGTDSVGIGAYASFIADNGVYVNGLAKLNHYDNDMKVYATDGLQVKADYRSLGVGASVEVGRRFDLKDQWFVEPQMQVSVFGTGSQDYRTSNKMKVQTSGGTSAQVRVGSIFGKRFDLSNGNAVQPYVKLGWVQELDGSETVRTNGVANKLDMSGGRMETGLGLAASLGKNHRLYADYGYSKGAKLTTPWSVNAGYRYVF